MQKLKPQQVQHQLSFKVSYLACPFAHLDVEVRRLRHAIVNHYAQQFLRQGQLVYSPLTHNIPLHHPEIVQTWQLWETFDKAMLSRCNALMVLQMAGWHESVGVTAEIAFAESLGLPIDYLVPETNVIELYQGVKTA